MRISAATEKCNIRGQSQIAGNFFPSEVKRIFGEPHVLSAARDDIRTTSRIEFHGAFPARPADIAMTFKRANGVRLASDKERDKAYCRQECSKLDFQRLMLPARCNSRETGDEV